MPSPQKAFTIEQREPIRENLPGIILEFKVFRPGKEKNLEETAHNALVQIEEKRYDAELEARGIPLENICHYGFAFQGKKVLIEGGSPCTKSFS